VVVVPYLLNQVLVDYMDVQDNGIQFHYSWLLIVISLVGWNEPRFLMFVGKGKCYTMRYENLWKDKDNKNQQANNVIFPCLWKTCNIKKQMY
jgi:hypothetical protein